MGVRRLAVLLALSVAWADSQQKFPAADVHVSAKATNPQFRNSGVRGGRYELKDATMVDMVRVAYGVTADKVVGGPNWLELDRFDVIAKMPPEATADDRRAMLQALLVERFGLETRKTKQPMPAYALTVSKKALVKQADGEGESGCKTAGALDSNFGQLHTARSNGQVETINLGPGGSVQIACRNMTMAAFATAIRTVFGAPNLGPNPVIDDTGLQGGWNFDFRFSLSYFPAQGDQYEHVPFADALEKQTGLKLVARQVPVDVIAVDKVNRTPSPNPPGTDKELPPVKQPTEFEVADVKPADPTLRVFRIQNQPGGRFSAQGVAMITYLLRAFAASNREAIVGAPAWVQTGRFDITAKAPMDGSDAPEPGNEATNAMIRSLLVERFKLAWHSEKREVSTYSLVTIKPKMKKADPASRTFCKQLGDMEGGPQGTLTWRCQNITMDEFADRIQNMGINAQISWPVKNETGLEGSWDFTFYFSPNVGMNFAARGEASANNPASLAADPGGLPSFFQAVEHQLGLKLEPRKRPEQVIVIDHLEQKPADN